MKEITYKLTIDDYVKYQLYFINCHPKRKVWSIIQRLLFILYIGFCLILYSGITDNVWISFAYFILLLPIWFFTRIMYEKLVRFKMKRVIKNNNSALAETSLIIKKDSLIKRVDGVTIDLPLSKIKKVSQDKELIYIEFTDGIMIIPIRAFENEMEKGKFVDIISTKKQAGLDNNQIESDSTQ